MKNDYPTTYFKKITPNKLDVYYGFCRGWLRTPFGDIIVQGVLSTPLRSHIIVFVVILKFLGYIMPKTSSML
ncbi:Uncharacterised protein [Moraxella caprae]|uniref:Uncharacterized protein n=1 Tax=Moraxella caprae TaxID=90240 RepID=A0A378QWS5_9GAMM|nr:Uncharacterised protein [Moraxella caprae]